MPHRRLNKPDFRKKNAPSKPSNKVASFGVKDGSNIVVFPESLLPRSQIQVIGEDELDKWLKKR